jgi:tetratricopeptide (TPR) repeat protein
VEAILREQEAAWRRGERPPAELYLERYPALKLNPEAALDVIHNEYCLRRLRGEAQLEDEFCARFPEQAGPLRAQFRADAALEEGLNVGAPPREGGAPGDGGSAGWRASFDGCPTCIPPAAAAAPGAAAPPGLEILVELGRGGMGVVFLARQRSPERLVALKVLRGGDLSAARDRERFRREADALAHLQHPNIVTVYQVGEFAGAPFLVMEYVAGGTLTRRLARGPLPLADAARLVEVLAGAAHAAHEHGIVHRDLKPDNVLLSLVPRPSSLVVDKGQGTRDEGLFPKIADFGLARRLDRPPETHTGAVMGTPSYMAPEQAAGRVRDIGPATDVYALGAILYELLTGRPPFRGETTEDTLRQVLSEEPVAPRRLAPALRKARDLETVCLCCLAKEPAKRYASASALADDLRRFLDGRPVLARRTPPWERAAKWVRRKPAAAALVAVVAAVALGLAAGLPAYAIHEHNAAEREKADAERLRAALAHLQGLEDQVTRWGQRALADVPHTERLRREMLTVALEELRYLTEQSGNDPALRRATAQAHHRAGDLQALLGLDGEAQTSYESARDLFAELGEERFLADAHNSLGNLYRRRGEHARARTAYEQALALRERLGARPGADAEARYEWAATQRNLALVLAATGDGAGALARVNTAIELLRPLADGEGRSAPVLYDLAAAYGDRGNLLRDTDPKEAEQSYQRAEECLEDFAGEAGRLAAYRQQRGNVLSNRGLLLEAAGRTDEAEKAYGEATGIRERLAADFENVPEYNRDLLATRNNECGRRLRQGRLDLARVANDKALERAGLAVPFRDVPDYRHEVARAHANHALLLLANRDLAGARAPLAEAIAIEDALVSRHPDVPAYALELARLRRTRGTLLQLSGDPAGALPEYEAALAAFDDLPRHFPPIPDYLHEQAVTHDTLGTLQRALKQPARAAEHYRAALELYARLAGAHPTVPLYRQGQAGVFLRLAVLVAGACEPAEGPAAFADRALRLPAQLCYAPLVDPLSDQGVRLLTELCGQLPGEPTYRRELAAAHAHRGCWHAARLPPAAAANDFREAVRWQQLAAPPSAPPEARHHLCLYLENLAEAQRLAFRLDDAVTARRGALRVLDELVRDFPADAAYRIDQAREVHVLAELLLAQQKDTEAIALLRPRLFPRQPPGDPMLSDPAYHQELRWQFALLATALLNQRQPEAAADVAAQLASVRPARASSADIEDVYVAASCVARCAGAVCADGPPPAGAAALADCYAWQAVQWLRQVQQAAPANVRADLAARLAEEGPTREWAFDALRGRRDFRELIRDMAEEPAARGR